MRLRDGGVIRLRYGGILATGAYTYGPRMSGCGHARRMSSCGYDGRLRLGSVVRLRGSHGTVRVAVRSHGAVARLRDSYGRVTAAA